MHDVPLRSAAPRSPDDPGRDTVAAVDLGSNSFHMVIARLIDGELGIIDRLKEPVRLADGLDRRKKIGKKAQERALSCLGRFAERLRGLDADRWRAVGTNPLRVAKNAAEFREHAEEILGHPIEVVSGQEEARLIHLAVARDLHAATGRTLVVDIGGGSTEIMLGDNRELELAHSLDMGCVAFSEEHFAEGQTDKSRFKSAETAARLELRTIQRGLRRRGWERCVGTSGTINATQELLKSNGWSTDGITLDGLRKLRKAMIRAGTAFALELPGLSDERRAVLPGGLAILKAAFESLEIESMTASDSALREGVLYDLVGRLLHDDARDRTIDRFVASYHVDEDQAERVEKTALEALARVSGAWGLTGPRAPQLLSWAARLHETGLALSYSGHHRHGAYLITNSFMPGFSADDQLALAAIVRGHRRKLSLSTFAQVSAAERGLALRACVLLRLAVLLNRSRGRRGAPPFELSARESGLEIDFPKGWLAEHPLTLADLKKEAAYLRAVELRLDLPHLDSEAVPEP